LGSNLDREHWAQMRQLFPDQAWFWSEEWQEGEKEADEDLLLGLYQDFDNIEELIVSLNEEIDPTQ